MTNKLPLLPISRKAFTAWLEQQPPRKQFRKLYCDECPVACFLEGAWHIGGWTAWRPTTNPTTVAERRLPHWAQAFIIAFDTTSNKKPCATAADALKIMRGLSR